MPTVRILDFILQDEFNDWREGEMLIQSMLESDEEVDRAMTHQAKLEKLMLAAGGIAGPGSIGDPYVEALEDNYCEKFFRLKSWHAMPGSFVKQTSND